MPSGRTGGVLAVVVIGVLGALGGAPSPATAQNSVSMAFVSRGERLSGELLLPAGRGPHPAVVMLHGAGPDTRAGYRPVAESFAEQGVAAFIFDKRGSGRSQGDPDYRYAELAGDARAAVRTVRARPEIRIGGVGLWGLSEGGFIAPLAAAGNRDVTAVAVISPSGLPPIVQQEWAVRNGIRASGGGALAARPVTTFYRLTRSLGQGGLASLGPRRARDVAFAPDQAWRRVTQPVLAVWGTGDNLVPIRDSATALNADLEAGVNRARTFLTFRDAEHDLSVGYRDGRPVYAANYLRETAAWLRRQLGEAPPKDRVHTPLPPRNGGVAPRAVSPPGQIARHFSWAGCCYPAWRFQAHSCPAWPAGGRGRPAD